MQWGTLEHRGSLRYVAAICLTGSISGFLSTAIAFFFDHPPDIKLALVESVAKKTAFIRHVVEAIKLEEISVYTGRAEDLARGKDLRDGFDLVVVRALAKLPLLLELGLPFCKTGANLVALKHAGDGSEQDEAANALSELNGFIERISTVQLDGLTDDRVVISVKKMASTPARYPRAVGVPRKRPL